MKGKTEEIIQIQLSNNYKNRSKCTKCASNARKWSLPDCSVDTKTTKHEKRNREIDYHHRSEREESPTIPLKWIVSIHLTAAWLRHRTSSHRQISSESRRLKEHGRKIRTQNS